MWVTGLVTANRGQQGLSDLNETSSCGLSYYQAASFAGASHPSTHVRVHFFIKIVSLLDTAPYTVPIVGVGRPLYSGWNVPIAHSHAHRYAFSIFLPVEPFPVGFGVAARV